MIKSGVQGYITGRYAGNVYFPVDLAGNADIRCRQCYFFRKTYSTCGLNGQVCEYPDKYIGSRCPLNFDSEEDGANDDL